MGSSVCVKTENLVKTFSGNEVIKRCNLTVNEGSIYGFLGANGAGKTTVFKLLLGFLEPTAGRVEVLGMDVSSHINQILRNVGSIIEVPVFYDHLSAKENLEIHLSYMGIRNGNINEALEMVGLSSGNQNPVSKFSLGMRQRLGIARALVHKPKLLILDEPINGLDPMGIREMRDLFLDLKAKGMTILISSHILGEIEHIADTVGVVAGGTVVKEVPLSEIKERYQGGLEDYFFEIMAGGKQNV